MFKIDLLKGQGIPIKKGPWGVAIITMTLAMPIFVALVMLGFYLGDRITISAKKRAIANYEKYIGTLSGDVKLQKSFEDERSNINRCLSEALSSIGKHTQWSPVLATVAENMPDSMILTRLEVKQRSTKIKVPRKDDPKKMIDVSVPVRTLQMSVSGRPQANSDKAVKEFMERLRYSASFAPKLEEIGVSQESDTLEGQNVVSYEIDCVFKPEL